MQLLGRYVTTAIEIADFEDCQELFLIFFAHLVLLIDNVNELSEIEHVIAIFIQIS